MGNIAKISHHVFVFLYHDFTILCHVGFTILSEQCSLNNFPIIKTKPFKVTKCTKVGEDKNLCHYFIFRYTKIHITNTHNIQIKQTALYSDTIGIFSRAFKKLNEQIKNKSLYRWIPIKAVVIFFSHE